jgi:hypothetical protein
MMVSDVFVPRRIIHRPQQLMLRLVTIVYLTRSRFQLNVTAGKSTNQKGEMSRASHEN